MPSFKTGAKIYNLFPRLVGKMDKWEEHFPRIKDLGFDYVYINPFHYAGFSGSLYAPKDYYDFNPLFVDTSSKNPPMKQLEHMIEAAKESDLKMVMDLVINHTAKDHPFTRTHADWYLRDEKGEVKSPGAMGDDGWIEWGDLAEIDNENSSDKKALWAYWKELVEFYVDKGFEGFRADAAYQVPAELWEILIQAAKKKNPKVTFFAESLGCLPEQTVALGEAGFDYLFNSSKWWDFNENWLLEQNELTRNIAPSIAFPESHDTLRLAHEYGGVEAAIKQRILFTGFFSAGWMITMGMEYGFKNKTDVVMTMPTDWENTGVDLSGLIKGINETRSKYAVFNQDSEIKRIYADNGALTLLLKTSKSGKEKVLFIINRDLEHYQHCHCENFAGLMEVSDKAKILDLTVGHQMSDVPNLGFDYGLPPAEIKIFYAKVK